MMAKIQYQSPLWVFLGFLLLTGYVHAASPGSKMQEWEKTVVAAKQEGKLNLNTQAGKAFRRMIQPFKQKYPEIQVEQTLSRAHRTAVRVISEQKQGVYHWDVMVAPTSNMATRMAPAGAFQPLLPFLILPEVTDDSKWHNGFEMWANDETKKTFTLIYRADISGGFAVNRDFIPKEELKTADELLDPKWKGKIVTGELRRPAVASLAMAAFFHFKGKEFMRRLLLDQEIVIVPESRLLLDRLVKGRNPIAIGESSHRIAELGKAGIKINVDRQLGPIRLSTYGIAIFKKAPHPNAAKVFVNWFLSREGQKAAVEAFGRRGGITRRVDVKSQASTIPDWKNLDQYLSTNQESGRKVVVGFIKFYKKLKK